MTIFLFAVCGMITAVFLIGLAYLVYELRERQIEIFERSKIIIDNLVRLDRSNNDRIVILEEFMKEHQKLNKD